MKYRFKSTSSDIRPLHGQRRPSWFALPSSLQPLKISFSPTSLSHGCHRPDTGAVSISNKQKCLHAVKKNTDRRFYFPLVDSFSGALPSFMQIRVSDLRHFLGRYEIRSAIPQDLPPILCCSEAAGGLSLQAGPAGGPVAHSTAWPILPELCPSDSVLAARLMVGVLPGVRC